MLISIAAMVAYVVGIEPKYRKRNKWKLQVWRIEKIENF